MAEVSTPTPAAPGSGLRRELRFWETIVLSIAGLARDEGLEIDDAGLAAAEPRR